LEKFDRKILHRVVATLDIIKSGFVPTFPYAFPRSLVLLNFLVLLCYCTFIQTYSATSPFKPHREMEKNLGSRFECFLLFQTGKNRTQLNCRMKRWGSKIRTVARKSSIRDLTLHKETWHSENLIKSFIYGVSCFNGSVYIAARMAAAKGLVERK